MNQLSIVPGWQWILLLLGLAGCGQPGSPTGGPRDDTPPLVTSSSPKDSSLNFSGSQVRFVFNEPIRKPGFDKEIYISPFVKRPKIILSDNARKLTIKFQEDLRPQTTYIITLTDVKDLHESNGLKNPHVLAFSTGDILDSMEIKGKIFSPIIGKPEEKMTVLLFDADSIVNDSFTLRRPSYVTQSNESGEFTFQFLRNAPYKILGIDDSDQSNSYSGSNEKVAISPDSLLLFEDDSTNFTTVKLYSFLEDPVLPLLRNYIWGGDSTLLLRFNKNLRLDSFSAYFTDTTGRDTFLVEHFSWLEQEDPTLFLHTAFSKNDISVLHLEGLKDSLLNPLDTVIQVDGLRAKQLMQPTLVPVSLNLEKTGWELFFPKRYHEADKANIVLTDTSIQNPDTLDYALEGEGFRWYLRPESLPDTALPFILHLNGSLADTSLSDSVFRYNLRWFAERNYGTYGGSIRLDSPFSESPIVFFLLDKDKKNVRTTRDTTFFFERLKEGNYQAKVILDTDNNGVWTPGKIKGRKLPEQIFLSTEDIQIRANWDFDDQVILVSEKQPIIEEPTDSLESSLPEGILPADRN